MHFQKCLLEESGSFHLKIILKKLFMQNAMIFCSQIRSKKKTKLILNPISQEILRY